ncbi:MAG: hypothetical protein KKA84_07315 [Bacteroidetes bacterium]|nr:hypothetical protein [Bacteroidota bacterium]
MSEKQGKIHFILEIYKAVILTLIAVFLFISLFDISIQQKRIGDSTEEVPVLDIQVKDGNSAADIRQDNAAMVTAKINRDELTQQCSMIATECQRYYRTPKNKGGGGSSFYGFELDSQYHFTEKGNYTLEIESSKKAVITSIGVEIGKDGLNPVRVICIINPVVIQLNSEN